MAFQFPWTNFHELNLDWFLSKFKQFTNNYLGTTATAESVPYGTQPTVTVTGGELDDDTDIVDPFIFNFKIPAGQQGEQGVPGQDGFSPIATVTKSGNTATISITDKNGTTTATVTDGELELDDTLTQSGKAADAKATGDVVNEVKSIINDNGIIYNTTGTAVYINGTKTGNTLVINGTSGHTAHLVNKNICGFLPSDHKWRVNGNATISYDENEILQIVPSSAGSGVTLSYNAGDLPILQKFVGETVAVSALIKGETENLVYLRLGDGSYGTVATTINTEWRRLAFSYSINTQQIMILKSGTDHLGNVIYVKDFQIEFGNQATKYTDYNTKTVTIPGTTTAYDDVTAIWNDESSSMTVQTVLNGNPEEVGSYALNKYRGKSISILGDSISTFGTNVRDNKQWGTGEWTYYNNRCRYPYTNYLTDVNDCYWKILIDTLGLRLNTLGSWAGSKITWNGVNNYEDDNVYVYMAGGTRIGQLNSNGGDPDVILVHAGSNDIAAYQGGYIEMGTFDTTDPSNFTDAQINALPRAKIADAYRLMLIRLQKAYPNAEIICCIPSCAYGYYDPVHLDDFAEVVKEECDYFGIKVVDLRPCGITMFNASTYMPDTIHPNVAGMHLIAKRLINAMLYD